MGNTVTALAGEIFIEDIYSAVSAKRGSYSTLHSRALWLSASLAVLAAAAAATLSPSEAWAANYTASNEAELRAAIDAANLDGDPSSTIILTDNITLASDTPFSALTKPLTINTGNFTLSGQDIPAGNSRGGSITFPASATSVTIIGDLEGGNTAPGAAGTNGGTGFLGESLTLTVTDNSSITGGRGGASTFLLFGFGGVGVDLLNGTLINNGVITGGEGVAFAGVGARLEGGVDHTNNGRLQGGVSPVPELGGAGLDLIDATLTNNGEILGGSPGNQYAAGAVLRDSTIINNKDGLIQGAHSTTADPGGFGILLFRGHNTIINYGTIAEGGSDVPGTQTHAILADLTNFGSTTIINAGTIRGSIFFAVSRGILELHAGSKIEGQVETDFFGNIKNDILRLGGDEDETFDVSKIDDVVTSPDPHLQYLNFDIFEKTGASTWTIIGQGTLQDAPWDIYQGTMLMSAGSDLGNGAVDIFGGVLAGFGTVGPTTNHAAGTIAPDGTIALGGTIAPGDDRLGLAGLGTLTIDGDYMGSGGRLAVVTVLGDDNSPTDLLAINGGTVGNTFVHVTNLGGTGAQTNEGIKIVDFDADASGNDSSDGLFLLLGDVVVDGRQAVIGGAYAYSLFQGTPTEDDGDWYLRSIGFSPTNPVYESYPGILLGLIDMPTFQQRVGNVYMPSAGSSTDSFVNPEPVADVPEEHAPPANFWTRIEAAYGHHEGQSDTGTEYDLARYLVQVGIDGRLGASDDGILIAGINAQYGHADADIDSDIGDGDNATDSYGGGLTLTWVGASGFYADAQAMVHYLESDLSSDAAGDLVDNNEGWGYGLSLELGRKLALDGAWSITPQAQLMYRSVDFDDFTDELGVDVSLEKGESLKGRLGVALGYDSYDSGESRSYGYIIANLTHEFLDAQSVDIAGVDFEFEPEAFGGELGLGGTYEWAGGKYSIHGEALGQTSFEGSYGVKGTAGFSVKF